MFLNKMREAQWLADQLLNVKEAGRKIQVTEYIIIPSIIGETSIYLYTK